MKSKIASVLGLVIPLSIALTLTAFSGCGGGSYGDGTQAYDGTWELNLKGYALPPATTPPAGAVSCTEDYTTIVIAHGFGKATEGLTCVNAEPGPWVVNVDVQIIPDAEGTTGTVTATTTGGAKLVGTCMNRVSCQASGFWMRKL